MPSTLTRVPIVELTFTALVFEWRGPAPHHFVAVPEGESAMLAAVSKAVTYGWGMIPVEVEVSGSQRTTALWPRQGGYVVPLRADLRRETGISTGDLVTVTIRVDI